MPENNAWLTGMMTGMSQAMGGLLVQKHQEEREDEQNKVQILSRLLQSGDLEAVRYFDEKTKKKLGFTEEMDQHLDKVILLQQQQSQQNQQMFQEKMQTSKLQRQAAQLGLEDAQRTSNIKASMTPEEQKQMIAPGIEGEVDKKKKQALAEKHEAWQEKYQAGQLDVQQAQIASAHADRMASQQARQAQAETQLALLKDRIEEKATSREDRKTQREDIEKRKTLESVNLNYSKAQDRFNKIDALRPRDKKKDNAILPFKDKDEAEVFADKLNKAQKDVLKYGNKIAELTGGTSEEMDEYVIVKGDTGALIGAEARYHVMPKSLAGQSPTTTTSAKEKSVESKPQYAHERWLKDAPSQQKTLSIKTPSEAANATKFTLQAQSMATQDPAGAVEILKKFMPQNEAENVVKNNLFDALIQALSAQAKGK